MTANGLNWVILVSYFALTIWIGRRFAGPQASLDDYLLAGRTMPWWAASLSIVATETSTLTFIGIPGIAYGGDLTFLQVAMGYVLGRFFVAMVLVRGYFQGTTTSAYEVLARRFGGRAQTVASLIFVINRLLADGVRLFATALVLVVLLPLGVVAGLRLPVAIFLVAGVTLYYTLRGGLRAVMWNDVVQQFIYIGGAGLAAWVMLQRIPGGWEGAVARLAPVGKLTWLDLSLDFSVPLTLLGGLIGGAVLTAATHGTDQMFVQRLLATGSPRDARLAVASSGVVVFVQIAFFLWIGTLLFAYYDAAPPLEPFANNDAVFPRFIAEELPQGIGGLVIAAVFAAAMSTLSSSLSSLASASTIDLYARWRRGSAGALAVGQVVGDEPSPEMGTASALRVSRRMTIVWAVVLAVVAFMAQAWGSVLVAGLTITSVTFGAVLGIFIVGQTRWRVSADRAAVAMVLGIVTLVVVHARGGLGWTWYTLLGATVTVVASGVMGAIGAGGREQNSDTRG